MEQYVYAGLDYIMPNCRGRLPKADTDRSYYTDHGDPAHIKDLIAALDRRGESNLKIAIFDDAPASWAAARNMDLYRAYVPTMGDSKEDAYPIGDLDAFYKYVWDYNIKLAFDNFYGENAANNKYLLRIGGKPLLVIWSPNGFVNVEYGGVSLNCNGKLKAVIDKLHEDFKATYGEEVHICLDIAGKKGAEVSLPATGGEWKEVSAATVEFEEDGWRETVLNIVSGSPDINCFTIVH